HTAPTSTSTLSLHDALPICNVAFLEDLKKAKVRFVAIDMPEADATQLQMMMVFAEHEARAISARTKAALEAAKKGGAVLGRRNTDRKSTRLNSSHLGISYAV